MKIYNEFILLVSILSHYTVFINSKVLVVQVFAVISLKPREHFLYLYVKLF